MKKRKAVICTILFAIIFFTVIISTIFIETSGGEFNLFYLIGSWTTSMWMGDCVKKFYNWLISEED